MTHGMIKAQDALIIKLKREVSNMKRKVLSVLLCAGMIATMLAGCGQKNEEAAAPAADDSTAKESPAADAAASRCV